MDAEWKRKWVEALRSGEYVQGQEHLHKDGKMCCLGVLCDLVGKETGKTWERDPTARMKFDGAWDYPPQSVQAITGIGSHNPMINGRPLATLNDQGSTFLEIADLIEKYL